MLRCAKIADELAAAAVARGIDRPREEDLLQRAPGSDGSISCRSRSSLSAARFS